jgi:hypothetical protein
MNPVAVIVIGSAFAGAAMAIAATATEAKRSFIDDLWFLLGRKVRRCLPDGRSKNPAASAAIAVFDVM